MTSGINVARWTLLPLSLLTATGVTLWAVFGLGGLGRTGNTLFNWHPVLMSFTALVLLPQGVLRWSTAERPLVGVVRIYTKWLHVGVLCVGFVVANVAIGIAYTSHVQQGLANFYSLHSWIGIVGIGLLKSNLVGGLLAMALPGWKVGEFSGSLHRRVGVAALTAVFLAAITGFGELQAFVVRRTRAFAWTAVAGGVLGLFSCVVAGLVWNAMKAGRQWREEDVCTAEMKVVDSASSKKGGNHESNV